jgi:hypothetical protein
MQNELVETMQMAALKFFSSRNATPQAKPVCISRKETNGKERNAAFAFLWLLVGLAPIPILLVFASSQPPKTHPDLAIAVLIVCALCNLCGAFGCLGGIKNVAVRVILGIFLFLLSWLVALLEMCSHSGGI